MSLYKWVQRQRERPLQGGEPMSWWFEILLGLLVVLYLLLLRK